MSHGITEQDQMVSTGKTPWHGLGVRSDHLMTPEEALNLANLNWNVVKTPLYVESPDHDGHIQFKDWVATTRSTDGLPLGCVKPSYTPIDNQELLAFLMAVVRVLKAGDNVVETAGSLFSSRVVWFLLHLPLDIDLGLGGKVESYVVIASSHNATLKPTLKNTPTRVECANTLDMAIEGAGNSFSFKHQANWREFVPQAREALGVTRAYLDAFEAHAKEMMRTRVTRKDLDAFTQALFPAKVEDGDIPVRVANRRDGLIRALDADNLQNVRLTKWALYNAAAAFIDHDSTFRETEGASRDENRAYSILQGQASSIKARAAAILEDI